MSDIASIHLEGNSWNVLDFIYAIMYFSDKYRSFDNHGNVLVDFH